MGYVKYLRGIGSGAQYPADSIMNLCPRDGRPVEIVLDLDRIRTELPNQAWYHPDRKDMWRFGALLPLDCGDADDRQWIVSLGEGHTPLLDYSDHPVAKKAGIRLEIKEEGSPYRGYGANPTRSFKDRGMAVAVSMAKKLGLTKVAVPTQGNAGDSLAAYARAAGLEAAVVMPDNTPVPILGNVAALALMNNSIVLDLVEGTIREAGQRIKEKFLPQGYFSVATFQEPGWRIEGKKTMGLELAEPKPGKPGWSLPDVVIYPTGGGTGILGMWKAFDELEALGVIGPERPRMVCLQSEGTCPLVRAFEAKEKDTTPMPAGETLAVGLNVPGGVGHFKVLDILYNSRGTALTVSEKAMEAALREAFFQKGWWLCPEGAGTVAAVEKLLEQGFLHPGEHVVAFNTGSFEKYLPEIRHLLVR